MVEITVQPHTYNIKMMQGNRFSKTMQHLLW